MAAQDERPRVVLTREGAVGIMTFNRAETLNTLDLPMLLAMEEALQALEADDAVRVIVATGCDDRSFIAGGDIADLRSRRGIAHYRAFATVIHRVFRRFEECVKPVIAAVNGWALGGGTEFLLTTDIRLMAEEAKLGLPEIRHGIFPGAGGSQRLMRQIAPCQAKLLLFTGDFVDAQQALSLGLVNKVVPRSALMHETLALAARVGEKSPWALRLLKSSMVHGADMPMSAAIAHEMATSSLAFQGDDAHEGLSAFLEKRKPVFKGE